jgi:hypothetical protein
MYFIPSRSGHWPFLVLVLNIRQTIQYIPTLLLLCDFDLHNSTEFVFDLPSVIRGHPAQCPIRLRLIVIAFLYFWESIN